MNSLPPCKQKHDPVVRCPDCQCAAESKRQVPRGAWILTAAVILGLLLLLLGLKSLA